MITTRIRRFIKAKLQPKPDEIVYVPETGGGEEWQPLEIDRFYPGYRQGPLYWASIEVEIDP